MKHITIRSHEFSKPFTDHNLAILCSESLLKNHNEKQIDIWAFCIMPDHLHLCAGDGIEPMEKFLPKWKSFVTHKAWELGFKGKIFQNKYFIKDIQCEPAQNKVIDYILNNPVRNNLVTNWREWQYWAVPNFDEKGWR